MEACGACNSEAYLTVPCKVELCQDCAIKIDRIARSALTQTGEVLGLPDFGNRIKWVVVDNVLRAALTNILRLKPLDADDTDEAAGVKKGRG